MRPLVPPPVCPSDRSSVCVSGVFVYVCEFVTVACAKIRPQMYKYHFSPAGWRVWIEEIGKWAVSFICYMSSCHLLFAFVAFVALALHFLGTERPTHMHTKNLWTLSTSHRPSDLKIPSAVTYFSLHALNRRGNHLWKLVTIRSINTAVAY